MLFDDEDEEYVSALFQVGDQVGRDEQATCLVASSMLLLPRLLLLPGPSTPRPIPTAYPPSVLLQVLQLKQKPHEGRECDKEKEAQQEYVSHKLKRLPTAAVCRSQAPTQQASDTDHQCQQLVRIQLLICTCQKVLLVKPALTHSCCLCCVLCFPCHQAMAHPDETPLPSTTNGDYDSAFPNVGLIVWQAGFVLGE